MKSHKFNAVLLYTVRAINGIYYLSSRVITLKTSQPSKAKSVAVEETFFPLVVISIMLFLLLIFALDHFSIVLHICPSVSISTKLVSFYIISPSAKVGNLNNTPVPLILSLRQGNYRGKVLLP